MAIELMRNSDGTTFPFDTWDRKNYPLDSRFHRNLAKITQLPKERQMSMLSGFRKGLRKGLVKLAVKCKMPDPSKHHFLQNQIMYAMAIVIEKETAIKFGLT